MRTILAVTALLAGLGTSAFGQESRQFTVNPVMAKGPATAPVTIVEFSDYQ